MRLLAFIACSQLVSADIASDIAKNTKGKSYSKSSLESCENYNNLIKTLGHKIHDDTDGSKHLQAEQIACDAMKEKQGGSSAETYWNKDQGEDMIISQIKNVDRALKSSKRIAKNVVLFVGGGMNMDTITAGRLQAGKWEAIKNGVGCGEEHQLSFDKFPYSGFSKTYAIDRLVTSSNAAGTAILSGFKTKYGMLNCGKTKREEKRCKTNLSGIRPNNIIFKLKKARGIDKFKAGIVTNTEFTDPTVAAAYTIGEVSKIENTKQSFLNSIVFKNRAGNSKAFIDVSFSGGKSKLKSVEIKNLKSKENGVRVVESRVAMDKITNKRTKPVVGLFEDGVMSFEDERCDPNQNGRVLNKEPSLSEMTEKAVQILDKSQTNGFFLMVKNGLIERAHIENKAVRAIQEMVELDLAIQKTMNYLESTKQLDDTLIIVTSDHGQTFTFGAWDSPRGLKSNKPSVYGNACVIFGCKYFGQQEMNAGYYMGGNPGPVENVNRIDYTFGGSTQTEEINNSGEDVPIFANGPHSHMLSGVHEQAYIGHVMEYATCTGEYTKFKHSLLNSHCPSR